MSENNLIAALIIFDNDVTECGWIRLDLNNHPIDLKDFQLNPIVEVKVVKVCYSIPSGEYKEFIC